MANLKLGLPSFGEFKEWGEVADKWFFLKENMTKEEFLSFLERVKNKELNEKDYELLSKDFWWNTKNKHEINDQLDSETDQ